MEVGWSGKEVGWSGEAHQRWEDAGSGLRRDGSWKSEPLSDPLVEEQLDGWVGSLEGVEQSWKGRKRTDVSVTHMLTAVIRDSNKGGDASATYKQ